MAKDNPMFIKAANDACDQLGSDIEQGAISEEAVKHFATWWKANYMTATHGYLARELMHRFAPNEAEGAISDLAELVNEK